MQYYKDGPVVYRDNKIKKILMDIRQIAPYPLSILLKGESGVGKDVIASFIHQISGRASEKFVAINCAALPESLIEAELFGYERGAFTGALAQGKEGLIESANGGVLFLNEINSLPLSAQGKLLTVLEEKKVRRIGGIVPHDVDFMLISATNQDLEQCIEDNTFRQDLYYRLCTINISIPPLRERKEDISALASYFMKQCCERYGKEISLSENYYDFMMSYTWPGNVRELKNFIERLVVMTPQTAEPILKDIATLDLPSQSLLGALNPVASESISQKNLSLSEQMDKYECELLQNAIAQHTTLREAAKFLDIPPSTLSRKMKKYSLKPLP